MFRSLQDFRELAKLYPEEEERIIKRVAVASTQMRAMLCVLHSPPAAAFAEHMQAKCVSGFSWLVIVTADFL